MAIQNEPTRIQIPFADSGTKNVIPDTNSTPSASQAASWTDGFPAQCSLPLSAGGIPPARADFNGLFNTMSQSLRFTQEGGVWAWDATVDYGTNRMVLGSDGLLYWSVAQSGPNVGGAQDPTADTGVYWQAPYAKTMPSLENSSAIATCEWVRDAVDPASFYVDGTNGDDSSDGLTQGTAVKTIGQALLLASYRAGSRQKIYLAAGTYAENIVIQSASIELELQGNVTINGYVEVSYSAFFFVSDSTYTMSIVSPSGETPVTVMRGSKAYFFSSLQITATSSRTAVSMSESSHLHSTKPISVSCTSVSEYAIEVAHESYFDSRSSISMNAGSGGGIYLLGNSYGHFVGGIKQSGSFSGGRGLYAHRGSVCYVFGTSTLYSGVNNGVVVADSGSCIEMLSTNSTTINIVNTTNNNAMECTLSSCIWFLNENSITFNAGNASACLLSQIGSAVYFTGSGTYTFNGSVTVAVCQAIINGSIRINPASTFTGSITGKRYDVSRGGQISVASQGANRIPGTVAGTADSTTYGCYI